jgi:hypothetical protein
MTNKSAARQSRRDLSLAPTGGGLFAEDSVERDSLLFFVFLPSELEFG